MNPVKNIILKFIRNPFFDGNSGKISNGVNKKIKGEPCVSTALGQNKNKFSFCSSLVEINIWAIFLLALMFALMFLSSWNDSATMDEQAHIGAGYSYLTQKDMRLNPEHPPLLKDLAALPLLFLNLNPVRSLCGWIACPLSLKKYIQTSNGVNFPTNHSSWQKDVNGQWISGSVFLYESGNNADTIIRLARIPIMLLAIFFGWLIFIWTRGIYGNKVGLFTLLFYTLSPTFLAHSRYVTTDLGAAFGFFIGIIYFIKFLNNRDGRHLLKTGVILGISLLLKFSLFLLAPFYFLFGALWVFLDAFTNEQFSSFKERFVCFIKEYSRLFGQILIILVIAAIVIWSVYLFHTWNYPPERQKADTEFILSSFGMRPVVNLAIFMSDKPILRPFSEYLLGLLMVVQRASGGNTTYFWGEVSAGGWWYYFPVAYILKEHLAFHLLSLLALALAIKNVLLAKQKSLKIIFEWMKDNFTLTAGSIFILIYWLQSIKSPLNIGVRHILPTFPFIYIMVSRELAIWLRGFENFYAPKNVWDVLKIIYRRYIKNAPKYIVIFVAYLWMFSEIISAFPHYLSYYNELGGGVSRGYKYITDSNYDWGQDLKRLEFFVEKNNLQKIYVDYFGGGSPKYYLGDKYEGWNSSRGAPPPHSYFAISATFLEGATGKPAKGLIVSKNDTYEWLKNKTPVARAGTSIFIYEF